MTIKNKLAPPMVKSQFAIEYGKGTVDHHVLTEVMKTRGFITNKGTWKKYECLDKSLQPNMDHDEYPGHLYGLAKFNPWFLSEPIQNDLRNRFIKLLEDEKTGVLEKGSEDDLEEGLSFEVESEIEEDSTPDIVVEDADDGIMDSTEEEMQV